MTPASVNSPAIATPVSILLPQVATTTVTGSAVDMIDFDGLAKFILHSQKGSGNADNTLAGKLQECETSGGTFVDIPGATFATVLGSGGVDVCEGIVVDMRQCKRFVKFVGTIAGSTPSYRVGVTAVAMKKYNY